MRAQSWSAASFSRQTLFVRLWMGNGFPERFVLPSFQGWNSSFALRSNSFGLRSNQSAFRTDSGLSDCKVA